MARPEKFDIDALLTTATELVARDGPEALTMAALARSAGAPSGSVYHRLTGLPALRAAVWLRGVEEFQADFLEVIAEGSALEGCVAVAGHVISWSRAHRGAARVLMAGPRAFGEDEWDKGARSRARKLRRELERGLAVAAASLGEEGERGLRRVTLATVDMPLGLVRRRTPERLDGGDERLAAEAAWAMLGGAAAGLADR
jgi:AcrR family transcriptional regulator